MFKFIFQYYILLINFLLFIYFLNFKEYANITCADSLANCATYKANNQCSGSTSILGGPFKLISSYCPVSCGTCPSGSSCILYFRVIVCKDRRSKKIDCRFS